MRVSLRAAVAEDLPQILELDRGTASAPHWTEAQYAAMLVPGGETLHSALRPVLGVAMVEGVLVGFVAGRTILHAEAEIESVVVAEPYRRQGLGVALCRWILEQWEAPVVRLEVRQSNAAARGLYALLGFVETGVRRAYYHDPVEDAVQMERS